MKKIVSVIAAVILVFAAVLITVSAENKKLAGLEASYVSAAEAAQTELDSLQTELQAVTEELQTARDERQTDEEMLRELFQRVDYRDEPVYVIGHTSPDSDTVASSIGMAFLLNELGIPAEARLAGPLNLESEYALSAVGYPAPEILENAADKQLWLVDHSVSSQMVSGADKARIVGITDHHGIGNTETSDPINILSCPVGSTSALVYSLCAGCGVELPRDIAGVLLTGLLSDTSNMKSKFATALDEAALDRLKILSGISDADALFDGMLRARLSYRGMDDREIFYSDFKSYETNGFTYGIANIKVAFPDQVPEMAERMLRVTRSEAENGCELDLLLFEVYDSDYSLGYTGFTGKDAEFAETVVETAFGAAGEKKGECCAFSPSLARKTELVPPIDDCLKELTH